MRQIHPLADVQTAQIGENTNIWQFCVILPDVEIGENCNICSHCFIENDVKIGNNVTVKCGVYLWDGITIEDNVFVGPNVTFTNDKYPRSKQYPNEFQRTIIKKGASIGAGSIILCGITISENAMIGAGSMVTKNIPVGELWVGSPAKFVKIINERLRRCNTLAINDLRSPSFEFNEKRRVA
jgi:acetyltransferase-like isoleucine patch superfamily enzyme